MAHPLVEQLLFTRSEFRRGLAEVVGEEAQRRFGNMNCVSWIVGHLAWQEQRYWLTRAQGQVLIPDLNEMLAYGKPACTPEVEAMWEAWQQVTQAADLWLEGLTLERLQAPLAEGFANTGTFLYRNIYHYWYHLGEGMAIRQMLGHTGLPDFVGNIDGLAAYRPERGEAEQPIRVDELVAKVREARARWESLLARVGEAEMLQPGVSGEWTLKDIVAHITWHEREMVKVMQARALVGSDLWNFALDERNRAIFEEFRAYSLERVRAEAQETYQQLVQEIEGLEDEDLHDPSRFAEMPEEWKPWQILADNTYQHYLDHCVVLEEWLRGR